MASGSNNMDVSTQFQKMAEKFGWLKHGDLDQALQSMSNSSKKKKSTKSRTTEKKKKGEVGKTTKEKKGKMAELKTTACSSSSNTPRKPELTGFLSSDSDSSFTTVPEQITQPVAGLRALCSDSSYMTVPDTTTKPMSHPRVICSDSDEEEKPKEDTYISCIGESALWVTDADTERPRLSGSPLKNGNRSQISDRVQCDRKSFESDDYEESILRNRLSMMSLISDVDSIGEPLVESTRIHRRSSVTYQQLMATIDKEECDKQQPVKQNIYKGRKTDSRNVYNQKYENKINNYNKNLPVDMNDDNYNDSDPDIIAESPETSPVKDVKYVTALEIIVDEEEDKYKEGTTSSSHEGLDSSQTSSNEIVEVVDVATQTQCSDTPVKPFTPKQSNPVCKLYSDETLDSSNNKPAYSELTVVESTVGRDNSHLDSQSNDDSTEYRNSVNEMSVLTSNDEVTSPYDQTTISNISTNSIPKKIDFDKTDIDPVDDMNMYSQITVDMTRIDDNSSNKDNITENMDINKSLEECSNSSINNDSDMFSEISSNVESNDNISDKQENSNLSNSDTSVYEVVDVGTQTESENLNVHDKYSNLTKSNTDDIVDDTNCIGPCENSDTDKRMAKCNSHSSSDFTSSKGKECFLKDLDTNQNSNFIGSSVFDLSDSKSCDRQDIYHRQNGTGESNPNLSASVKPKVGKKKQKASHCFDISSDSDIEDNIDETHIDRVDENDSDGSVSDQFVNDNVIVNEFGSTNREDIVSDSGEENHVKGRPERSVNKATERLSMEKNYKENWRDSQRRDSGSSSDDNFEAFLQKIKNPEKKKSSESSHKSMKDFIVEDDEMTSESDDEVFYIKETQKLDRAPLVERLKQNKVDVNSQSEESSDEAFSSKLYPSSVTKHKKKRQQGKSHASSVCSSLYWDSSDSDDDTASKGTRLHDNKTNTHRKATWKWPDSDPEKTEGKNKKHKQRMKIHRNSDCDSDQEDKDRPKSHDGKQTTKSKTRDSETKQKDVILSNSDQDSLLFKTPNPIRKSKSNTSNKPDQSVSSTSVYNTPLLKRSSGISVSDYISLSDDDDSSNDDSLPLLHTSNKENVPDRQTPRKTKLSGDADIFKTPLSALNTPRFGQSSESRSHSFLKSLSNDAEDSKRHLDAVKYIRNFKKTREELVKELFDIYNNNIFDKKLPKDLPIIWNKRLLKTAGYCAYRCNRANKEDRTARIELSTKVCDTAERVRDTLIHELCHAAVWLLNGVNGGHGNFWRYWARHASSVHPELPAISRCHSYSISTKFTYRCTRCGYSIGRHSKSLDTTKKICGYCKGTFELIQNATPMTPRSASSAASSVGSTPRTPNRFALFVKDNYNSVKQKNKDLKHGDVMKELSRLFAANKINS